MEKTGLSMRRFAALLLAGLLLCGSALAAPDYLIPGGNTVGIELAMRGVLVVDVEDGSGAAAAGVRKGDNIISADGVPVDGVQALRSAADRCGPVALTVLRNGQEAEFLVTPQDGQLGLLVRDRVAGIGTITYIDPPTGRYGALGHGVNELGQTRLLPVQSGILVPASVRAVRKGVRGTPGLRRYGGGQLRMRHFRRADAGPAAVGGPGRHGGGCRGGTGDDPVQCERDGDRRVCRAHRPCDGGRGKRTESAADRDGPGAAGADGRHCAGHEREPDSAEWEAHRCGDACAGQSSGAGIWNFDREYAGCSSIAIKGRAEARPFSLRPHFLFSFRKGNGFALPKEKRAFKTGSASRAAIM